MEDFFDDSYVGLEIGAYLVTCGPFKGRICENDDNDFLGRNHFSDFELELYDQAGVAWKKLKFKEYEGAPEEYTDEIGTFCEHVSFGHYVFIGHTYIIPAQALRPANMNDLVSRADSLGNEIAKYGFKLDGYQDTEQHVSLLCEWVYVLSKIKDREVMAQSKAKSKRTVFLCHSSSDKPFVRQVYRDLQVSGHKPWMDEFEIMVGDSIVDKISSAHEKADYLIVFLSQNSVEAPWVKREWQAAFMRQLNSDGIRVLPAKLDDCTVPSILSDIKYANFGNSYLSGLTELLEAISSEPQ